MSNLAIQTSFIGDSILSLPFFHELLRLTSDDLILLSADRNREIFEVALKRGLNDFESRVRLETWKKKTKEAPNLLTLSARLRTLAPIGHIFCLHRSFRTGLLAWLVGGKERVGFSSGASSYFYTKSLKRSWDDGELELQKNLSLLREFFPGVSDWNPDEAPSLLSSGQQSKASEPLVCLSLGSPWPTKRWDKAQAVELCRMLLAEGVKIQLIGDEASREIADHVEKELPSVLIENLCGKSSIEAWIDLIDRAHCVVSSDSAAVHVASDLKVPVVALFGPTVVDFGFAPWRSGSQVLATDLKCRPCHIHGPKECPLKHHRCMKELMARDVFRAVERVLSVDSKLRQDRQN